MLCILSENRDPYFHLAAEQYFLHSRDEEYVMVWQSNPAVVVGKHQNTLSEINYPYVVSNNIQVARRLSGGGAVYHDEGNINFTFIRNGEEGKLVDFTAFISPVLAFLKASGIKAVQGPKNDILADNLKVSGNAEHVYRRRVLHHGTLLFKASKENLYGSLKPGKGNYTGKSVISNRSRVINLAELPGEERSTDRFMRDLYAFLKTALHGSEYTPTQQELTAIDKLVVDKFRTWEWIYGWSPDYEFRNTCILDSGILNLHLKVHKGIIRYCSLESPDFSSRLLKALSENLTGIRHQESALIEAFSRNTTGLVSASGVRDLAWSFLR